MSDDQRTLLPEDGDGELRHRALAVLDAAFDSTPEERPAVLAAACGDDAALRAEVEALLAADARATGSGFLDTSAGDYVPELFDEEATSATEVLAADPMIGRRLGPYEVVRRIGVGGMGVVYEGRDVRLSRRVALKLLSAELSRNPEAKRRLEREAHAASALDHPNVCTLFDVGEAEDGRLFLVLAYYEGETLESRLEAGPLPVEEARELTVRLARGLAHAHAHGVVHRDVKPANLMLTTGGELKILDFGVAHTADATELTRTGRSLGTPAYMSPEQVRGEPTDARTDLWSLGVILYQVLTGRRPFAGGNVHAVLHAIVERPPPPLEEQGVDVPEDLAAVLAGTLAKRREDRFADAGELLAVLADPSSSTAAVPPSWDQSPAARRRAAGFGFLGGLLLIAGAVALILWGGPRTVPGVASPLSGPSEERAEAPAVVPSASPVENYRRGRDLLVHGYRRDAAEQAIVLFRAALAADEDYAPAHAGLAEAYLWRYGRDRDPLLLDRAREQADLAVEKGPQLAAAYVARGTVRSVQGEVPEATADLEQATRLDPLSTDAHRELANVHQRAGRADEAVLSLDRAAKLAPEDWRVWERQGLFALWAGAPRLAERPLRRTIELAPDNPNPYKNLAVALIRDGRLDEAASALQQALEVEPWESTYTNLGTLQFLLGRYEASRESFESAIELGAQDYLNWGNLADAYRWTDRPEQAADAYRRAIQLLRRSLEATPEDATKRSRLALYLAKQGDGEAALAELETLPEAAAGDPNVLLRRLVVEEIAGRRDAALDTLEAALEAGVSLDDVERDPELSGLRGDPRYQLQVAPYVAAGDRSER